MTAAGGGSLGRRLGRRTHSKAGINRWSSGRPRWPDPQGPARERPRRGAEGPRDQGTEGGRSERAPAGAAGFKTRSDANCVDGPPRTPEKAAARAAAPASPRGPRRPVLASCSIIALDHTQTPSPPHPVTLSASSGQSSVPRPDVGNRATVAAPVEFPRTRPGTRPARQPLSSRLQRRVSRAVRQRPAQSRSFPDGSRGFVRSGPPSVSTAGTSLPSKCPHAKRVK